MSNDADTNPRRTIATTQASVSPHEKMDTSISYNAMHLQPDPHLLIVLEYPKNSFPSSSNLTFKVVGALLVYGELLTPFNLLICAQVGNKTNTTSILGSNRDSLSRNQRSG
jgi:hypothetical protein